MTEAAVFLTRPQVPLEIISFFGKSTTSSLLVKGVAGTGKTTFALEMLEVMSSFENVYYVSTRVSNDALYRHYPWLKDKELHATFKARGGAKAQGPSSKEMAFLAPGDYFSKERFMYSGIRRLEDDTKGGEPAPKQKQERQFNFETPYLDRLGRREAIPDIEAVYRKVNENIPNKSFFVLDSLKGLVGKYSLEPEELVFTLQKDLVERNYADILLVMEEAGHTPIDFLVDGVVENRRFEEGGRRYRTITLQKLRGEEIRQPEYLVTLHDGHFKSIPPYAPPQLRAPIRVKPLQMPAGFLSTGAPEVDDAIGGGYPAGSNVLVVFGPGVPNDATRLLATSTILNALATGLGVMLTPFAGTSLGELESIARAAGLENEFRNHLVIATHSGGAAEEQINMLPLDFVDIGDDMKKYQRARMALEDRTRKGVLEIVGVSTVVSRYGLDAYTRDLNLSAERTRTAGNVTVRFSTSEHADVIEKLSSVSDIHLGLEERCGAILFCGIKPKTQFHHISWKVEEGMPLPKLLPIV